MSSEGSGTKIALWNGGRVFSSNPKRYKAFVKGVHEIDADILVIPEALNSDKSDIDPQFEDTLGYMGEATIPYDDDPTTHPDGEQWLRVLMGRKRYDAMGARVSSPDGVEANKIRLGTRNALRLRVGRTAVVYAGHKHDKNNKLRARMTEALIDDYYDPAEPTALVFDENSMHSGARATTLRRTTSLIRHSPIPRVNSLSSRLYEMTDDEPLQMLELAGFRDADPASRPTNYLKVVGSLVVPIAQLDHLMVNGGLEVSGFAVHHIPGSDQHWPISATLTPQTG